MKKMTTIILAAGLAGAMLFATAACSNSGGNTAGSSDVRNPFLSFSSGSGQTDNSADRGTFSAVPSESVTPLNPDEPEPIPSLPDESFVIEPSVSSYNIPYDDDSDIWDDDDSDLPVDSDGGDDDFSIPEYSMVTPKGTVNPAYAGKYILDLQLTDDELKEMYGAELDTSTLELIKSMKNMSMTVELKTDGSAVGSASMMGESSTSGSGSWSAEGTKVYITLDGVTVEFDYDNGVLTEAQTKQIKFIRQ
jgi:hypothetical protein